MADAVFIPTTDASESPRSTPIHSGSTCYSPALFIGAVEPCDACLEAFCIYAGASLGPSCC